MEIVRKILLVIGVLIALLLSPMIIGVVTIWAVGLIVIQCLSLLIAQAVMACNPSMRIKEADAPIILTLLRLIPIALEGGKSRLEKIVIVIAGIVGAILAIIDCWLLGDVYWIPILVGVVLYFILTGINSKRD
jgi:hypothetical protein